MNANVNMPSIIVMFTIAMLTAKTATSRAREAKKPVM
jgi:hypothetical protein